MRRLPALFGIALAALLAASVGTRAQTPGPTPLFDPNQLPAFHGRLQLFTLTPQGDIGGFVLADGTEVKTPPHLTGELARAVKPGDEVTVHGLKAASLPLVQAMSVGNDATGATVVDAGPPSLGRPTPPSGVSVPVSVEGRLRMLLHGPRGDVNGALLEDGTVLDLPPPEAARFSGVLVPGRMVAAEGLRRTLPTGSFVDLTALGPEGGPLRPVKSSPRSGLDPVAPPPG